MKKGMIFSLFIVLAMIVSGCSNNAIEPDSQFGNKMQPFKVTDQNGKPFAQKDMKGKVYIADFIFTKCETVCPPMTYNMSSVIDELEKDGVKDYGVISFSVDPENDTPQKLKDYVKQYNAPQDKWTLVTNYDFKFIKQYAEDNFKSIVAPPPKGSTQVTHGTSFYLIDQNGKIIKTYSGQDAGDKKFPKSEIVSDVKTLVEDGPVK
ncbi:SCO family protein [Mammaliicoccus sp. Dog046]|uniref:SCO family protein n=1 Tax=Mammaliicoccus sp. Dog046 TaxID=3034233 RepID=UPI002B260C58|nr:SCO family protein [Mammaliicoccus sp. Dog046]WQK84450.1 SCO family protein [Mammaliicoccus sp. Dog046]